MKMNNNINIYNRIIALAIVLLVLPLITFLTACGAGGTSGDTEPPVIESFYPGRGATDIPVNTQIVVKFNKSVINVSSQSFLTLSTISGRMSTNSFAWSMVLNFERDTLRDPLA